MNNQKVKHLNKRLESIDKSIEILIRIKENRLTPVYLQRYKLNSQKCTKLIGNNSDYIVKILIDLYEKLAVSSL